MEDGPAFPGLLQNLFAQVLLDACDNHASPLRNTPQRDRFTNTRGTPRDNNYFILKAHFSNRLQHALDHLAPVHPFKRLVPFSNRPHTADDRPHIKLAARKEADDAFPDWPVMAEASL